MPSVSQPSAQQRSLYRRHRPRSFDDVVGQDAVVRTLRNAVELGRVNHAYLFVGSRGTGKTSLAKILAACLNCEQGPTTTPCGACASCVAIAEARSLDVIEMDAASHNSVEDIRELRDSVAFQPLSGRWKVYILDEAHMLSNAAWNAFLKTLEEPPSSTVFVMATTEAQKVPATVIDRCHRFDFQRPTVEQVAKVIGRTADAEGIAIPAEAVAALAKAANGSFRDALGALEQIVTYGGEQVALDDVLAVLGVAASETVEAVIDAVARADAKTLLLAIEGCVDDGRDLSALLSEIEARARELLVTQVLGEVPRELSLTPDHDERLAEQARRVDAALLTRLIDLLGFAVQVSKAGGDVRTQLELALLKAARPEVDPSTKALLARIERLESGAAPRLEVPTGGGGVGTRSGSAGQPSREDERPASGRATAEPATDGASTPSADPSDAAALGTRSAPPATETRTAPAATLAPEASAPSALAGRPAPDDRPAPIDSPPPPTQRDSLDTREPQLDEAWPAVVALVREGNALLGAVIEESAPLAIADGELTVGFPQSSSFNKRKAEAAANKEALSDAIAKLTGRRLRLAFELREDLDAPGGEADSARGDDELLRTIIAEFDAEELPAGSPGGSATQEGT